MPSFDEVEYHSLMREGLAAVKAGYLQQARRLLEKAIAINKMEAEPWIWLSATTDDPQEQRKYLEYAVAVEPGNPTARRGLLELTGQLDQERLTAEGVAVAPLKPLEPAESQAATVQCPQCGGRVAYDTGQQRLVCKYCGVQIEIQARRESHQAHSIDHALLTTRAHRWAEVQQRVSCERCGAVSLLPPGQMAHTCSYCGSNRLIQPPDAGELLDPQAIIPFQHEAQAAAGAVKAWLGKGLFAPDDLALKAGGLQLRPAYYAFWAFSGTLELSWSCEVNQGSSDSPNWVARKGSEFEFFDELIAGVKAIQPTEAAGVGPFDLKQLVDFNPEVLLGWPAVVYDRSMADASLLARERVTKRVRRSLHSRVEPGHEKRNLNSSAGKWSGQTFKHLLLPLWVGTYHYQGKDYRILVNGQTGKVYGVKPQDRLKMAMVAAGGVILAIIILLLLYWGWSMLPLGAGG